MNNFFTYSNSNRVNTIEERRTPNHKVDIDFIVDSISQPPDKIQQSVNELRKLTKQHVNNNDDSFKGRIGELKKELPYFMFSGWCTIHHSKENTVYNGCVQIDIDVKFKGGNAIAKLVKEVLTELPFISCAFISPSGYGVKAIVPTTNTDKTKHKALAYQINYELYKAVNEVYLLDADCFDIISDYAKICYTSFDRLTYYEIDPNNFVYDEKQALKAIDFFKANKTSTQKDEKHKIGEGIGFESLEGKTLFDKAVDFSKKSGYYFKDGTKHNFLTYFIIACVRLGINKVDARNYIDKNYNVSITSNVFAPYQLYKDSFGVWKKEATEKDRVVNIEGKQGQKASEILKGVDISNTWLQVPTGSGKTYLAANHEGVKIIVCPITALVKNICERYGGFECRGRGNNWRQKIESATTLNDLPKLLVVGYQSFKSLYELLGDFKKDIHLFIDEGHNFSSAPYLLNNCHYILECMPEFKATTLLTGTYLFNCHPYLNTFDIIKVKIPRPDKKAQIIFAENTKLAAAATFDNSVKNGRIPIVLFDNKNEGGGLGRFQKLIESDGVKVFNSDKKTDLFFQQLSSYGVLDKSVKGIITTSVIREGINIDNTANFDIIIIGNFHSSAIEQMLNRPRNPKDIKLHIIKPIPKDDTPVTPVFFNDVRYGQFITEKAQNTVNELNTNDNLELQFYERELQARKAIQYLPIRSKGGVYEVDFLGVSNYTYQARKTAENKDIDLLKASLKKYGIKFDKDQIFKEVLDPKIKKEISSAVKETKQQKEQAYNKEVEVLKNLPSDYIKMYCEDYRGRKDTAAVKKLVCNRYLKLSEYLKQSDCIKHLEEIGTSESKFKKLLHRLNIWTLEQSQDYMNSNREFTMLIKNIRYAFKEGDVLSSDKIKEILLQCLRQSVAKTFDIKRMEEEKRNSRTLDRLRLFFDLKRESIRIDNKVLTQYRICRLILCKSIKSIKPKISLHSEINIIENKILTDGLGLKMTADGYPEMWDN